MNQCQPGVSKAMHLIKEKVNQYRDDYYEIRGWNSSGIPTEAKLKD